MFGRYNKKSVVVSYTYDPAADDVLPLFRASQAMDLIGAYATIFNDVAAHTANYFSLQLLNGGSAGTAAGTITAVLGGSAGWTGLTARAFTLGGTALSRLAAGDIVTINYDESGTGTFVAMAVQLDYVDGIGS